MAKETPFDGDLTPRKWPLQGLPRELLMRCPLSENRWLGGIEK